MTVMALVILGVDLLLKEKIGYGTIIDALLTDNFVGGQRKCTRINTLL